MGSFNLSHELNFDFKPTFLPKTITSFLEQVSKFSNVTEKVLKLDDFVNQLETEKSKVEAFKQELPLCMLLINDAIVALKEESNVLKKLLHVEPVLEEFIPLKNSCDDDTKVEIVANENDNGDKKNWLSSTHLWNTNENLETVEEKEERRAVFSPEIKNLMKGNGLLTEINGDSKLISCSTPNMQTNARIGGIVPLPSQQQTSRKQRRCWSTELHRRFVNALEELGGSQVATPKQIRELMQVDGLTNDEVKSHLQKYRLHTRRLPSSNTNQSSLAVGGRLWMSKGGNPQSGSPDGPLTNGENNMDDEEEEKSENYCWNP
ncbi:Homeodomain-like protein [Artemisia annua]|uniref:Homeodomain-like protein n=1 Tax=Artemisia annua TaxID=35608 RepID=A0A2U1MM21_ARTAN|nr:Homeodomain-like protein [Artemisia annua]